MRDFLKAGLIGLIIAVLAVLGGFVAVLVVGGFSQSPSKAQVGGYTEGHWDAADGYKVDGATIIDGSGNISAPTSGSITAPTAASATSTLLVGEIETYPTSSATKVCLRLSPLGATSTFAGTVFFNYGSCP